MEKKIFYGGLFMHERQIQKISNQADEVIVLLEKVIDQSNRRTLTKEKAHNLLREAEMSLQSIKKSIQ